MIRIIANLLTDFLGITEKPRKLSGEEHKNIQEARRHGRDLNDIEAPLLNELRKTALKEIDRYWDEMNQSGMAAHMQLTRKKIKTCKLAIEDKVRDLGRMPLKDRLEFYQQAQMPGSYGMHHVVPSNIPFGPSQKETIRKLIATINERIMWEQRVIDIEDSPNLVLKKRGKSRAPRK